MSAEHTVSWKYIVDASQGEAEDARFRQQQAETMKGAGAGAASASAGYNRLEREIASNRTVMNQLDRTVAGANVRLAQMRQQIIQLDQAHAGNTRAANRLKVEYATLSASTRELGARKRELAIQTTQMAAQVKVQQAAEVAAVEAASSAWARKTTRISVGRGVLSGYDAALEGVLRATGGINLGFAVGIGLLSTLLPKIIELTSAEKERLKIESEQIQIDALRGDSLGRVVAAMGNQQAVAVTSTRVNADLVASLRIITDEQSEYEKNTARLGGALDNLNRRGVETQMVIGRGGQVFEVAVRQAGDLQHVIGGLNQKLVEQEKAMEPALENLRNLRDLYNLTTPVVMELGRAYKYNEDQLRFVGERIDEDLPKLQALASAMLKGSENANDLARAVANISISLASLSVPKIELGGTPQGIEQLQRAVLSGLQQTFQAGIGGSATQANDFNAQVRALAPTLSALDNAIKANSTSTADYNRQVAALNDVVRVALQRHLQLSSAYKDSEEAAKKAESAARALTDVTLKLTRDTQQGTAKLIQDGFDRKEALARLEFQNMRDDFARRGQLTALNLALINTLEIQAMVEIGRERRAAFQKEFGELVAFRIRQREERLKMQKEVEDDLRAHLVRQRQIRIEEEAKFFFEQRSDRSGRAAAELEQEIIDANKVRVVADMFGFASRNAQVFELQLKAIEAIARGDIFGALVNGIKAVGLELIQTGELFLVFGDAVSQAFERAIASGESLGDALKAAFLGALADIAASFGRLAIAMGTAMLFMPGMGGKGVALIAAGFALMVLAGVLRGLAANIGREKAQAGAAGGGAAAGGTGAQRAPGPGPERIDISGREQREFVAQQQVATNQHAARIAQIDRAILHFQQVMERSSLGLVDRIAEGHIRALERERAALLGGGFTTSSGARVIPFSGSTGGSGNIHVSVHLDKQGTQDFLDGKGVLTDNNFGNSFIVEKKVKRMAKTG